MRPVRAARPFPTSSSALSASTLVNSPPTRTSSLSSRSVFSPSLLFSNCADFHPRADGRPHLRSRQGCKRRLIEQARRLRAEGHDGPRRRRRQDAVVLRQRRPLLCECVVSDSSHSTELVDLSPPFSPSFLSLTLSLIASLSVLLSLSHQAVCLSPPTSATSRSSERKPQTSSCRRRSEGGRVGESLLCCRRGGRRTDSRANPIQRCFFSSS